MIVTKEALRHLGMKVAGTTLAVQGFGNVGSVAAQLLAREGCKIRAISDRTGAYYNKNGIDVDAAVEYVKQNRTLEGFKDGDRISNEELLTSDVDVLLPAALENVITSKNAAKIQAKIVCEGANGPTTAGADSILDEKEIFVIPDILANAGGVTVSYFEWVQDLGRLFWGRDEIRAKLAEKLNDAFDRVWEISRERDVPMRTAALVAGIRDVSQALEARGLYP